MLSKAELRKEARVRRRSLQHLDIGLLLAAQAGALDLSPGTIVGGYHALPDEADPALLLQTLVAQGCHIAFPRIVAKDLPLDFHVVPDGEVLKKGAHGLHEPQPHWPSVMPHILLVPLLAFDGHGHRLGYGGGFYDRTLAAIRSGDAPVIPAIGVGFSAQQVEILPQESHDMRLDGVLTELGLTRYTG